MKVANDLARSEYVDIATVLSDPENSTTASAIDIVLWGHCEAPHDGANRPAVMKPVYVGQCFGWLHTLDRATGGDVAALICPGLTRDRLDAHHSLRLLADTLARAGYPAMRFDYPGVGDSCDFDANQPTSAEPWQSWRTACMRPSTGFVRRPVRAV